MSSAITLPDLDGWQWDLDLPPEYVLAWAPPWLIRRQGFRRPFPDGLWELLSVEEHAARAPARPGWYREGPEDAYPLLLGAWVKTLLGYPVRLERGAVEIKADSRFSRWHTVTVYWVQRNS